MRVCNETIFSAVSMGASATSTGFSLYQVYGWAAQLIFTGSPVGSLKVQISCDPLVNVTSPQPNSANWTDLDNSTVAISAAGNIAYNVDLSFYNWVRFVYTRTSGSGTLNGTLNLKGA